MIWYLVLVLAGLTGGLLAGLLGIGGGLIYILVLPVICTRLGVPEDHLVQFTIANSLFATTFASLSASLTHLHSGRNYLKMILMTGLPAIIASVLVLKLVVNTSLFSMRTFNLIVVVVMIYLLVRSLLFKGRSELNPHKERPTGWRLAISGISGGILSPLSGLGGSLVIIPLLNIWARIDIKKAAAISIGVVFMQSLINTGLNLFEDPFPGHSLPYSSGYILFPAALILGGSVVVASPIGVKLAQKMSPSTIKLLFIAVVLLVLSIILFDLLISWRLSY